MKKSFTSFIIVLAITASVLFVSGILYYFYLIEKNQPHKITPQQKIENAVLEKVVGENKKTTHISDSFVRGEVEINNLLNNFYIIKVGDDWNLFSVSDQPISCEKGERAGFPASMISDCIYQSPNAKTSSDIKNKTRSDLLSEENFEIIGELSIGSDPSAGFMIVDENNNSVNINVGNFDPSGLGNLEEGDYIVVDVSVSENEDGELKFLLDGIEEIQSGSDNSSETSPASTIVNPSATSFSNTGNNNSTGNVPDELDLSEEIYYDIADLPPGYIPDLDAYYQSLIDRDFSGKEIEIISDF